MSTINLTCPRNYGEMSEKQIRYVAALQHAGMSEIAIWTKCFVRFTGIKAIGGTSERYYFMKKHLKGFFSLSIEETCSFAKKLDFLTKKYVGIQPMSKIRMYRPCDKLLRDTVMLQYLDAENYYQAFLFTKEPDHLHKLMATLYQLPGKKYSNDLRERHIKRMARRSEVEKLIVVMWMIGIKEAFKKQWPYLFHSTNADDEFDQGTAPDMHTIIQNQIRMLTGGDITKRSDVLSSSTWAALDELNTKARESMEIEQQMKNN